MPRLEHEKKDLSHGDYCKHLDSHPAEHLPGHATGSKPALRAIKIRLKRSPEAIARGSRILINAIISETIDGGTPQSFSYDDAGRLTDDGTLEYTWDRADRLLTTNDGVTTVAYEYNGLGHRVRQDSTDYLLDTVQGLPRVIADKTGSVVNRYVFSDHGLLRHQKPDSSWVYPLDDGLGSVRHIVDASLDPVYSVNHAPYGELWNAQGTSPMPFGFTAEWQDPNDLLFLRARYYNPALGVFLSLDPLEGGIGNVRAVNRYGYVTANPVNLVDPSGRIPTCSLQNQNNCGSAPNIAITFPYLRSEAARWAIIQSRKNADNPPPNQAGVTGYMVAHDGLRYTSVTGVVDRTNPARSSTGSATFISEALWFGGKLPMTVGTQISNTATQCDNGLSRIDGGWRACFGQAFQRQGGVASSSTRSWRNHIELKDYLTDYGLVSNITTLLEQNVLTAFNVLATVNSQVPQATASQLIAGISGIKGGDYLHMPNASHGFLIVGWGPPNACEQVSQNEQNLAAGNYDQTSLTLSMQTNTQVPYVVDYSYGLDLGAWQWRQEIRPRPFYCAKASYNSGIPSAVQGTWAGDFDFYALADQVTVPICLLYKQGLQLQYSNNPIQVPLP